MNAAVVAAVTERFAAIKRDDGVRAVILRGAGEKAFVAGADITQFETASPADAERLALGTKAMHDAIRTRPKPVVAAISGFCLGGGLELALACDLRIAATSARFGLPEIKLGVLPGGGGTVRLTRLVGASAARALALTGEMISADRALALGLLHALHEPHALTEAAGTLAATLASYSPFAVSQLKSALDAAQDADLESACVTEIKSFALCFSTEDQKEGTHAFLDKRPPHFTER